MPIGWKRIYPLIKILFPFDVSLNCSDALSLEVCTSDSSRSAVIALRSVRVLRTVSTQATTAIVRTRTKEKQNTKPHRYKIDSRLHYTTSPDLPIS